MGWFSPKTETHSHIVTLNPLKPLLPKAVPEMTIVSIKEEYLIVDRGGTAYVGELGHGLKPPISIHAARWCVMDCPVKWDVVM